MIKHMQSFIRISGVCLFVAVLASCSKKDENLDRPLPLGIGGDTWKKGPIDQWLLDSMTLPYNIEIKYRWDPWELHLDKTMVPPDESKVIPAVSAMKQIWI